MNILCAKDPIPALPYHYFHHQIEYGFTFTKLLCLPGRNWILLRGGAGMLIIGRMRYAWIINGLIPSVKCVAPLFRDPSLAPVADNLYQHEKKWNLHDLFFIRKVNQVCLFTFKFCWNRLGFGPNGSLSREPVLVPSHLRSCY